MAENAKIGKKSDRLTFNKEAEARSKLYCQIFKYDLRDIWYVAGPKQP